MLFESYERTDGAARRSTESEFAFLSRCSWKAANQVRDLLEGYLSRYPTTERHEIIARIQSGNPHLFASAVFELFLHECLLRRGFALTPHPQLDHSTARPDFLVECPDGSFYLEAVLASERGGLDPGSQLRIESTLDGLDDVPHPNFLVFVDYRGIPSTQPSASKLRKAVRLWLNQLDPDLARSGHDQLEWGHEDWKLTIKAIPVKAESRGRTKRLLAGYSGGGNWSNSWSGIRDAVKEKSSKYGALDKPLLIAVNYRSVFLDPIDELQALYGQEQILASLEDEGRLVRIPNGAWRGPGPGGPIGTRASGAWIFRGLHQYNAPKCSQVIYLNPWAQYALPSCLQVFPHHSLVDNRFVEADGLTFGQALGLDPNWLDEVDRS